jgi:chromosome segregation ATPase
MTEARSIIEQRVKACRKAIALAREELRRLSGELDGLKSAYSVVSEDTAGIAIDLSGPLEELEKKIRKVRAAKISIRDKLEHLEGELLGLKAAQEILGNESEDADFDEEIDRRGREMSPAWKNILGLFSRLSPNSVSIGDVMNFIAENDIRINRNAVRSQLHLYAQRGYLRRTGDGMYKATEALRKIC